MPEYQHHIAWLAPVRDAVQTAEGAGTIDAAILERGRKLCERILQDNPASELARSTLDRIARLLGEPTERAPSATEANPNAEALLQERIDRLETSFLAYGRDVMLPRIDAIPESNVGLKRALRYSFEVFDHNRKTNPLRNVKTAKRIARERGENWQKMLLTDPDLRHFGLDALTREKHPDQFDNITAGFSPTARTMVFHPKIDAANELHQFVIMHECAHIPQMLLRLRENTQLFTWLYANPDRKYRFVAHDEYQAYGLEIEALNLRLDGMLRREAEHGRIVPHTVLQQNLGASDEQIPMLAMLSRYAKAYFGDRCDATRNTYAPGYRDLIIRDCLRDGHETYDIAEGKLYRILPRP